MRGELNFEQKPTAEIESGKILKTVYHIYVKASHLYNGRPVARHTCIQWYDIIQHTYIPIYPVHLI
jgi:hypothetical protein